MKVNCFCRPGEADRTSLPRSITGDRKLNDNIYARARVSVGPPRNT